MSCHQTVSITYLDIANPIGIAAGSGLGFLLVAILGN